MKAVITGITGLRNRGIEALVVPTIKQLHQRQPNLTINLLTTTPDYDQLRLQRYGAGLVSDSLRSFLGAAHSSFVLSFLDSTNPLHLLVIGLLYQCFRLQPLSLLLVGYI